LASLLPSNSNSRNLSYTYSPTCCNDWRLRTFIAVFFLIAKIKELKCQYKTDSLDCNIVIGTMDYYAVTKKNKAGGVA
jgi:hypothetical protein